MGDIWTSALVIALCVLAVAILLTMARRREALTFLVGISAGLFGIQLFDVHVFTILLLIWTVTSPQRVTNKAIAFAVAIVISASLLALTAFTGDLVNSPTLGLQLVAMAVSAGLLILKSTSRDIQVMLFGLLSTCSAASVWAVLQVAGIVPTELFHLNVSAAGRPNGLYPEPDWMGMFAGIGLVLAWRLPLGSTLRIVLFTMNGLAFVLAFARAAWVAVAVSVIAALVLTWVVDSRARRNGEKPKQTRTGGRKRALLAFAGAGFITIILLPSLADDLILRLSRTLVAHESDVSAQARVQQNDSLAFLAQTSPWYGHGISSSGRVGVSGIIDYGEARNNVGSNWVVSMWVDGAWLSVALIALLIGVSIVCARSIPGQLLVIVLLNSFFSNVIYQPVTWLALGLSVATLLLSREKGAMSAEMPTLARSNPTRFGAPAR
jgi:hypothetical protein